MDTGNIDAYIRRVVFDGYEVLTPYRSSYREAVERLRTSTVRSETLWLCALCLEPYESKADLDVHRAVSCPFSDGVDCRLPGQNIARPPDGGDGLYVQEVLGWSREARDRQFCLNLCLLSKLFLDHKTPPSNVEDVAPFVFYVLYRRQETANDDESCQNFHLVGYFSKSRSLDETTNLACIMALPQYQGAGFGRALIDLSYQLTIRQRRTGTGLRPFSDFGLQAYTAYWRDALLNALRDIRPTSVVPSIDSLAAQTGIDRDDVVNALHTMNALRYENGHVSLVLPFELIRNWGHRRVHTIDTLDPNWSPPQPPQEDDSSAAAAAAVPAPSTRGRGTVVGRGRGRGRGRAGGSVRARGRGRGRGRGSSSSSTAAAAAVEAVQKRQRTDGSSNDDDLSDVPEDDDNDDNNYQP